MTVADHDARREVEQLTEGYEIVCLERGPVTAHRRQGPVRVDLGIAQSRKVLQATGDALALQANEEFPGQSTDGVGCGVEGTIGDPVGGVRWRSRP